MCDDFILSGYLSHHNLQVHADIGTVKVVVKNVPDYAAGKEKNDLGFLTFDLQADLNPLFNWNVKQLFLYLTAEYQTPNNKLNQVEFLGFKELGVITCTRLFYGTRSS